MKTNILLLTIVLSFVTGCSNPLGGGGAENSAIDTSFLKQFIVTQDGSVVVQKNTLMEYTVAYTTSENVLPKSCEVSDLQNVVVSDCSCDTGVCKVKLSGSLDFIGSGSFSTVLVDTNGTKSNANKVEVSVIATNTPSNPSGLVIASSGASITLTWSPPTLGTAPITYNVFRKTGATSYALLASGITNTSYTDSSISSGVEYFYSVSASNLVGTSAGLSNEVSGQLISSFNITGVSGTTPTLAWSAAAGASAYNIEVGTSSGTYTQTLANQTSPVVLSSLLPGTTYFVKVTALNEISSVSSNEVSILPLDTVSTPTLSISQADSLRVVWANVSGASTYSVRYGTSSGSLTSTAGCSTSPCVISSLTGGTTYYVKVVASNSVGYGLTKDSSEATGTPLSAFTVSSYTNTATSATTGSSTLTWGASTGSTSYDISVKPSSGSYSVFSNKVALTETVTGLTSGTSYLLKVTAKNTTGSLDSDEVTLTAIGTFSDSFDFSNSLAYTTGADSELSGGKGHLSSSHLVIEKTHNGTGTSSDNLFDDYSQKDTNITVSGDKISLASGTSGVYVSKALDKKNTTVSLAGLSYLTSLPFGKEISTTPETGYGSSVFNFSDGLTTLWRFNELSYNGTVGEVKDSKGSNHGKVFTGTVTTADASKLGRSAFFNGNSFMQVPSSDTMDNTDKMTISTWINPSFLDGNPRGIISKRNGVGLQSSFSIFLYTGNKLFVDIKSYDDRFSSNTVFEVNQWYHVVVVYDGTLPAAQRVKIYVNGVLDKVGSESATAIPANNSAVWIGTMNDAYAQNYNGYIDETAIWKKAFNLSEISELYRRGANKVKLQIRTCTSVSAFDCSGTVSAWAGVDGSATRSISELDNNSLPQNRLGNILNTPLNFLFSSVSGIASWITTNGSNRYVQVKASLESSTTLFYPDLSKISITPTTSYALSSAITTNNAMTYNKISSLAITQTCSDANGNTVDDDLTYALSFNGGSTYLYWTGSAWAASSGASTATGKSVIESLTATQYNLAPAQTGQLKIRSYLSSNGSAPCEVDNITVTGTR